MFVYAIKSDVDGRMYAGMAEDIIVRLKQPNAEKAKSTKAYRSWTLIYFW